jgi:predicted aspartyl protease
MDAIPFEMPSAQIPFVVMAAEVNGREKAQVLLDTGAAAPFTVMISPELAERGGAEQEGDAITPSSGAVGAAAIGFREARLAEFRLGPVRLRDVRAGVTPALAAVSGQIGKRIDAVVGHDFVRGRTISIDYPARMVDLEAKPGKDRNAVRFRLAPKRALTLVEAKLNGRGPFLLALDTGASATLISPSTAAAAGVIGGQSVSLGGAGGASAGGARLGAASITLGHLTREGRNVAIADVLAPIRQASGAAIDGVLGADFLAGNRIVIDYRTERLWIEKSRMRGK